MALNAKNIPMGGGNKGPAQEPIEAGTYPCRVVQVLDLGVQPQREYKGVAKPPAQEVMITYELLDEFCLDEEGNEMEDKPRWLSETMPLRNLENDLATSTKRYMALDPDCKFDGDFTQLTDIPCMVTIVQNAGKGKNVGKVYNNISNVATMRPKEARVAAPLVNEPKVFVLDEPDMTIFLSLPQWVQDKIKDNLEFKGSALEEALEDAPEAEEEQPKAKAKGAAKKAPQKPVEAEDDDDDNDGEPW